MPKKGYKQSKEWIEKKAKAKRLPRKKVICGYCKDEFETLKHYNRKFCFTSCSNKYNASKSVERMKGENNPMYGKKSWNNGIPRTVGQKKHHSVKMKEKYSMKNTIMGFQKNNKTKSQYKKGHFGLVGNNNPSWEGGKSFEPYTSAFSQKLKNKIRKRDNHICQKCGKKEKDEYIGVNKCNLTVHHIDYDKHNCSEKNLITLCRIDNIIVNSKRKYWTKHFNKLIINFYAK